MAILVVFGLIWSGMVWFGLVLYGMGCGHYVDLLPYKICSFYLEKQVGYGTLSKCCTTRESVSESVTNLGIELLSQLKMSEHFKFLAPKMSYSTKYERGH